jgi:hypothetical protein
MRRSRAVRALCVLLAVPSAADAFQADLVPASRRPELEEIEGAISISGEDGSIRLVITGVNDSVGDPLDSNALTVVVKVRAGSTRRRFTFPLTVDTGDGEMTGTLGLPLDARVAITEVRVRAPNGRTLAMGGLVTERTQATPPAPPPTADTCPPALESCQSDLEGCVEELELCEESL